MQMLKDNPDIPKIIKITKPVSSDENSIINLFKEYATKNEQNIQIIVEKTNEPIGKIICEVSPPTPNISFKSKAAAYQGFNALRRVSESIETSIAEEEFGTLVAASIKQKLKTSQSTDKETEKAG
jgi:alpha-mannosidase